jgi:hypothetical protein
MEERLFKTTLTFNVKTYIWIKVCNTKVGILTRYKILILYKTRIIKSTWDTHKANCLRKNCIGKNFIM